ncbi:MAG: 30S ribosome-binding factor RbfA [Rhodothermales bacterium]
MSIRTERVAKLLQREIADILQTEFSEQLPGLFTVTNVRMTKDLSIAYVDVSVYGQELTQRQAAFRHLEELTPQVRSTLANRIRHQVRGIPEVRFFLDESIQEAKRMDELFERIRAERERREAGS